MGKEENNPEFLERNYFSGFWEFMKNSVCFAKASKCFSSIQVYF